MGLKEVARRGSEEMMNDGVLGGRDSVNRRMESDVWDPGKEPGH